MRRAIKSALVAATLLAVPAAVNAETFLATSYNVIDGRNVPMTLPQVQTVSAGQIQLNGPTGSLLVWCLDLLTGINLPYLYNVNTFVAGDLFPGIPSLDALQVRQIASLMQNGIDIGDNLSRAATALAIWKVEYGANFNPVGLDAPLTTAFNFRLAQSVIGGLLDCPTCELKVLTDAPIVPSQAFGFVIVPPGEIPLPAAVWMFGSVVAGGALYLRRRRKVASNISAA